MPEPGWRLHRAAEHAAAAGAAGTRVANNANDLVLDIQMMIDQIQKQGYIEVEIDLTDNPPQYMRLLGIDGKIKVKIRLPARK